VPAGLRALDDDRDADSAQEAFRAATEYGERFGDTDLMTMGRLGQGQALIRRGQVDAGVALLDEAMIAVASEEVSPVVAGTVYCAVILACRELFDLRRAGEWTQALHDWCEAQPDLVPFRGQCLVHRSEILQFRGAWAEAWEEARRAGKRLSEPPGQPAVGMAHYQQGELLRLRGRFAEAERAYRRASEAGHDPLPGLALLRLAQGRPGEARAATGRALQGAADPLARARMLAAHVEILLACTDASEARDAAQELSTIASDLGAPLLQALAAHATGMVALFQGDAAAALDALGDACARWQRLEAPYEHAISRVGFAEACRTAGDAGTAELELRAAGDVLERLGATPDAERITPAGSVGRRGRRAHPAPDRGARAGGPGPHQPRDRRRAGAQRAHRPPPPAERLPAARCLLACRGERLRGGAWTGLIAGVVRPCHASGAPELARTGEELAPSLRSVVREDDRSGHDDDA
jgi:tetratricopeptide (TPR) repeat protein